MSTISFNKKDFNLSRIETSYPLQNYLVQKSYRIYGLVNEQNPLVLVETKEDFDWRELKGFFQKNNIQVEVNKVASNSMKPNIAIGLRRDLRCHVNLCGAIISTIIAHVEGKLVFDVKSQLLGIPRFNQ